MAELLLARLANDLGKIVVRPAPSGVPFIIDAQQAAERQIHHAVRVARSSDYPRNPVQKPLRTNKAVYKQAGGVSEDDSGRGRVAHACIMAIMRSERQSVSDPVIHCAVRGPCTAELAGDINASW